MADNELNNEETNVENLKISILELQKKYEIGRDPLYARMRYLQIKTWKVSGKAYLYADQVVHMDALHDHIKATGRMEGYTVPDPSGPQDESTESPGAIALQQPQQLEAKPNYTTGQRQHQSSEMEAIAALVRSAQGKATGFIIAENMLTNQYIQNPDSLPEELREKIKESAQVPEIDPFAYATTLTNFVKSYGAAA